MAQKKSRTVKDGTAKQQADKQKVKNDNINTQGTNKTLLKTQNMTSDIDIKEDNAPKGNNGGGKKPIFEKVMDRLDDLTAYSSQGISNQDIAKMLDISERSFYRLMAQEHTFKEAYNKGLESRKYELEKALFKRAEGFTAQEVKIETDGNGNVTKKIVTDKHYVPDSTALIFALKNVYGDKYKDSVETVSTVNVNIQQIQNVPDEELLKYANVDLIDSVEYEIK